ncbi:MAG TPA: [protein-PII] uridylyltransferase [Polyangiaceae bacterium]|nr:[protein-PII] uridylyltransferase [Polyangiaceae bacterium]
MQSALAETRRAAKPNHVGAYLEHHRGELLALLEAPSTSGVRFARRHAQVMDGLVDSLFKAALAALPPAEQRVPVVLAAVGGYGRGLLGWKSDLDLWFVTDEAPERVRALTEAMLYPLWDAGVSVGHRVATIADLIEAARVDLPTATSLLDFRRLAGQSELARQLDARAVDGIFSERELPGFLRRLEAEVSERYERFGDSVYLLEPEVKSGAGGLRDMCIAIWAARARFRTASINDLLRVGFLSARETEEIAKAEEFLWQLRNQLHRHANRRSDRLTFDEQEVLAVHLGYRERLEPLPEDEEEAVGAMVEAFMSDYYCHARVVLRVRDQIMARAMPLLQRRRPRVLDLGNGLESFNDQLTFSKLSELDKTPALALRLYAAAVGRGLTVLPFARDAVIRATSVPEFCETLRQSAEAAQLFVQLVANPQKSAFRNGSILAELHDVGLLVAMIPEFLPVVGRVHHDVYHVYTVDVHSVAAVDRLRALARGELHAQHPLASRLAAQETRPELLYLATLLHDVGKAIGGREHSQRGAEMARKILARLGLPALDIEDACHLILQHLVMYQVAARRNLEDPQTVSEFARAVHGAEGLRHLYLLTFVDLSTTSPTSMTKWKSHMLDDLFLSTDRLLANASTSSQSRIAAIKAAAENCWGEAEDKAFLRDYLDSMPDGYLLSNGPLEIASHARIAQRGQQSTVTAAMVPTRQSDVAELCVVTSDRFHDPLCVITPDRPGLLASISAAIGANGFDIHAAQVHSRRLLDGSVQAVDLFWITTRHSGDDDGFELAIQKLEKDLHSVLTGAITPEDLISHRRSRNSERPAPPVATQVSLDNASSSTQTLVEVVTRDRPGLLFTLSRAFYKLGLTIGVAKINTEGTRAIDVFYVTEVDGKKVEGSARITQIREALLAELQPSLGAQSRPIVPARVHGKAPGAGPR